LPNLKFLALTVREILGGPEIPKVGHVIPTGPLLTFSSLELTAIRLRAKFEVSSFNRSRDIRGSRHSKVGHVAPRWPLLT